MWSKHKKGANPRFCYDGVPLWEIGDRSMLNMLEQHVYFLSFVWLHAIFVEARLAGALGLVAVATRYIYPFLRAKNMIYMEFSTQPYWFCLRPLWGNVVCKLLTGEALLTYAQLNTTEGYKLQLFFFLGAMLTMIPVGFTGAAIVNRMIGDLKLAPGTVAPGKPTMMADEDEKAKAKRAANSDHTE